MFSRSHHTAPAAGGSRAALLAAALVILACVPAAYAQEPALRIDVVTPEGGAIIGRDLVLEVGVQPPAVAALDPGSVTVTVTTDDDALLFGEPYPLRENGGRYEWAAPVPAAAEPRTASLSVLVAARTMDGEELTGRWNGEVAVGFGDKWNADRIQDFIERRGFGFFLALVFGFGVLMSLSPCIYPMIPITLAVIGATSQKKGPVHGLIMSVTYVIGMALVYAVLGALAATVFSGITAFMQSPYVLVPLAVLLLVLSLSMFGAFELQAPAFLRDRLGGPGGGRGGLVGAFAMGLVAGLVASPCVGPFLGALLLWVGTTGNWVWGFFSLFTFGIGMGLLLIGVGTFPAMLGSLPGSGGWMETVKRGMGLLLVAMALYFVRPGAVLPASVFYPIVGVVAVLVAVFMGAFDGLAAESGWWPRTRKAVGLIVFAAGMYVLVGSFLNYGQLIPSPLARIPAAAVESPILVGKVPEGRATTVADARPAAEPLPAKVPWEVIASGNGVTDWIAARREAAKAAGKPVMIDFWAEWCFYCKKLDKDVWNVPEVVAESLRFVAIKVDATAPDDADMEAVKAALQVPGMPRVVFIDSRGELLAGRATGYVPASEMLEIMRSVR